MGPGYGQDTDPCVKPRHTHPNCNRKFRGSAALASAIKFSAESGSGLGLAYFGSKRAQMGPARVPPGEPTVWVPLYMGPLKEGPYGPLGSPHPSPRKRMGYQSPQKLWKFPEPLPSEYPHPVNFWGCWGPGDPNPMRFWDPSPAPRVVLGPTIPPH